MKEKIYALDKAGKIRVFYGEQEGTLISTYTGILGGKLTRKDKNITSGKQKRTTKEQATFELDSLYNEKYDEGYKSEQQVRDHLHIAGGTIENIYELGNIKYNTNRYWLPLPMLAEKYKDHEKKIKFPLIGQPKLNGVRCLTTFKDNKVIHCSRGGQMYEIPHLRDVFYNYYFSLPNSMNIMFDGEVYVHGVPLQTISGLVRLEDDPKHRKHILEYHIYDIIDLNQNMSNEERDAARGIILYQLSQENDMIKIVDSMWISSHDEIKHKHDEFIKLGYEGMILRDPKAEYQFGFRDKALIKVKEFIDEEFEIIGCEIDPAKTVGESFVFVLQNDLSPDTFKARPTGTEEEKQLWYQNIKSFIGKRATVRYFERSVDNIPTMGVLRHQDTKCLVEAIRDYE